ncbi:unnamed protein product [Lampetra fluviatilis]
MEARPSAVRAIARNSLVSLLQAVLHGAHAAVELRDETQVRGLVLNVDAFMNVRLADAELKERRSGRVTRHAQVLVSGRSVRYVLLPDRADPVAALAARLRRDDDDAARARGPRAGRTEFARK